MTPQELRNRTKKFAVNVIKFAKTAISSDPIDREIACQLTRAAGGTAAGSSGDVPCPLAQRFHLQAG